MKPFVFLVVIGLVGVAMAGDPVKIPVQIGEDAGVSMFYAIDTPPKLKEEIFISYIEPGIQVAYEENQAPEAFGGSRPVKPDVVRPDQSPSGPPAPPSWPAPTQKHVQAPHCDISQQCAVTTYKVHSTPVYFENAPRRLFRGGLFRGGGGIFRGRLFGRGLFRGGC